MGLVPGTENKFKMFVQWIRFHIRIGKDKQSSPFPMNEAPALIYMCKTHNNFIKHYNTLAEAANLKDFYPEGKWSD